MVTPLVEVLEAWRLKGRSQAASMVAMTAGKYWGRQPAMTALMASFSVVNCFWRMGSAPMMAPGARPT